MSKIIKYVLYDIVKSKIIIAYTLFLLLLSIGLFNLGGSPDKAILSLLNLVLLTVPLISIVFATTHFYNSYEFMELLVAQPIHRKKIFLSEYLGVAGKAGAGAADLVAHRSGDVVVPSAQRDGERKARLTNASARRTGRRTRRR